MRVLMDDIEGVKSRLDTMQTYLNILMLPPAPPPLGRMPTADDAVREMLHFRNRQIAAVAGTAIGSTSSTSELGIAPAVAKAVVGDIGSTPPSERFRFGIPFAGGGNEGLDDGVILIWDNVLHFGER